MTAHVRTALFVVTLAFCTAGQALDNAFPLTATRYGTARGSERLVTDGKDFYLFWRTDTNIRMTKVVEGEARVGRAVMPVGLNEGNWGFDVVWTGRYFLIAAASPAGVVGGVATTQAQPVGEPFQLSKDHYDPRLAYNGTDVLLVQRPPFSPTSIMAMRLTPEGRPLGAAIPIAENRFAFDLATNGDGFAVVVSTSLGDRLVLLDRNGAVRSDQSLGGRSTSVRIASDGRGYRAVGVTQEGRTWSATFAQDGSLGTTIELDDALAITSLVWTGNGYTAAFTSAGAESQRDTVRIDEIGRTGEVRAAAPVTVAAGAEVELTALGDRVLATWASSENGSVMVSRLPLSDSGATPMTFAAAEQRLITTASSDDATLVLWSQITNGREAVHLGVRGNDGSWTEQARPEMTRVAAAASDGQEFLVVYYSATDNQRYARRFDGSGRALAPAVRIDRSFYVTALTWNGQQYVAVGVSLRTDDIVAAFLNADGTASAPVIVQRKSGLRFLHDSPVIATNRSGYFVAWSLTGPFPDVTIGRTYPIYGVALAADLSPGKEVSIGEAGEDILPGLAWDGAGYVVAWVNEENERVARRVSPAGVAEPPLRWRGPALAPIHVAAIPGGVALAWRAVDSTVHIATVPRGSEYVSFETDLLDTYAAGRPRAVAVQGTAAVIAATAVDAAPWHGSSRLMMAMVGGAHRKPATAPNVAVQLRDGRLHVEWTQLKETVTGYRVEYRIGDGNWNEIDRSADPNVRTATLKPPRGNTTYAFRVRATSAGGMGPYSAPAVYFLGKRRAVR